MTFVLINLEISLKALFREEMATFLEGCLLETGENCLDELEEMEEGVMVSQTKSSRLTSSVVWSALF